MSIRRYLAATSREAMDKVRRELGDDAVVISNRRLGPNEVEILAAAPGAMAALVEQAPPARPQQRDRDRDAERDHDREPERGADRRAAPPATINQPVESFQEYVRRQAAQAAEQSPRGTGAVGARGPGTVRMPAPATVRMAMPGAVRAPAPATVRMAAPGTVRMAAPATVRMASPGTVGGGASAAARGRLHEASGGTGTALYGAVAAQREPSAARPGAAAMPGAGQRSAGHGPAGAPTRASPGILDAKTQRPAPAMVPRQAQALPHAQQREMQAVLAQRLEAQRAPAQSAPAQSEQTQPGAGAPPPDWAPPEWFDTPVTRARLDSNAHALGMVDADTPPSDADVQAPDMTEPSDDVIAEPPAVFRRGPSRWMARQTVFEPPAPLLQATDTPDFDGSAAMPGPPPSWPISAPPATLRGGAAAGPLHGGVVPPAMPSAEQVAALQIPPTDARVLAELQSLRSALNDQLTTMASMLATRFNAGVAQQVSQALVADLAATLASTLAPTVAAATGAAAAATAAAAVASSSSSSSSASPVTVAAAPSPVTIAALAAPLAVNAGVDLVNRTVAPAAAYALTKLLMAGFSPDVARRISAHLGADFNLAHVDPWLQQVLVANLRCDPAIDALIDHAGAVALIGPTGVGKTTSLAKLAARFAVRHGAAALGIITLDAYKVGAHEQLRTYGRILGVPVHVAEDTATLRELLITLRNRKLVLIDTCGLSQRDERLGEMLAMLEAAAAAAEVPIRRVLLLNAAAHAETLDDVARAWQANVAFGAVLTKLDEAARIGGALDCLLRWKMPLLGLTNGQRVPEDWHAASVALLAHVALKPSSDAFSLAPHEVARAALAVE